VIKLISKENKAILVFVIKFFLLFVILFLLISFSNLTFLNNFFAEYSAKIFGLEYFSNIIFGENINFVITNFCTGLVSVAILFSIIFAFKKPILINKSIIFVLGALILLIFNFFRILFVIFMAKIGFDAELIHSITWFVMSFLILFFWFYVNKLLLGYKKLNELLS